jgi:PilZ domain
MASAPTHHDPPPDAPPARFVIPVRYVAGGEIVQTTSTSLSEDVIHVRSARPPRTGLVVGLQLYFPKIGEDVRRTGLIAEITGATNPGFWAEFGEDKRGASRIAALLARHREVGDRGCPRFHTRLRATVRDRDGRTEVGSVTNISRSGAFVRMSSLPRLGSILDLELIIPGSSERDTVLAYVVHVAEHRGIGVQFIGGTDEFRSRLDEHVARLAA